MSDDNIDHSITTHAPSVVMIDRLGKGGIALLIVGIVLSLTLAAIAVTIAIEMRNTFSLAVQTNERETRLLQLKVDDMKVALQMQGYNPNKHLASDSP